MVSSRRLIDYWVQVLISVVVPLFSLKLSRTPATAECRSQPESIRTDDCQFSEYSLPQYHQIRADFGRQTIVVYQAFNDAIADAALREGRFVAPFSFNRMTWIKPSYLWLMERSGWGTKSNQNRILAIRITRAGWEHALSAGVLTGFQPRVHASNGDWRTQFQSAQVHVQWDPERSFRGQKLEHRSIQVGIGRTLIEEYVSKWIVQIRDLSEVKAKIRRLRQTGQSAHAKRLLPREAVYPVPTEIAARLGIEQTGK